MSPYNNNVPVHLSYLIFISHISHVHREPCCNNLTSRSYHSTISCNNLTLLPPHSTTSSPLPSPRHYFFLTPFPLISTDIFLCTNRILMVVAMLYVITLSTRPSWRTVMITFVVFHICLVTTSICGRCYG